MGATLDVGRLGTHVCGVGGSLRRVADFMSLYSLEQVVAPGDSYFRLKIVSYEYLHPSSFKFIEIGTYL